MSRRMVASSKNVLFRRARVPMQKKQLTKAEREIKLRADTEFIAQHGPVRILMQGGKKCNIIQTVRVR